MNNSYNSNIEKLNKIYKEYPEKTEKELNKLVLKLKTYEDFINYQKTTNYKYNKILIIIFIVIAILGMINLNINILFTYYFGLIFFITGYCSSLLGKGIPLIFLFSHGMTGLMIMLVPIVGKVINNPLLSDNPTNIYIYLGIVILLIIIATTLAIIYNLADYFKTKEFSKLIPAILYLLAIIMVTILPHIYTIIYNI